MFPDHLGHPYYIVSEPYSRFSAGIKALHLLCHSLNQHGCRAFMHIFFNVPPGIPVMHPDLLTPRLTQDIIDYHFQKGIAPIVVYPDFIDGNPLGAPFVVRYFLNFPGIIGGDVSHSPDELIFGYSAALARTAGQPKNVLLLPISDTRIFFPPPPGQVRAGTCFYAYKYRTYYGGKPIPPAPNSIEITRDQSPSEMAAIFRRSELLYCFESTSTALDAELCGCPAVFIPNPYLTELIAENEWGQDGWAWGIELDKITRAKSTVGNVFINYKRLVEQFRIDLDHFITISQKRADCTSYTKPLRTPFRRYSPRVRALLTGRATLSYFCWREGLTGIPKGLWKAYRFRGLIGIIKLWRQIIGGAQSGGGILH